MYLFMLDDGEIRRGSVIQEGDLSACDDGILDIVDISNPDNPLRYFDGKWQELEAI
jgi:hypothetical protein